MRDGPGAARRGSACPGRPCRSTRGCGGCHGLAQATGVLVMELPPDGPARAAACSAGDVIVAFDGAPVAGVDDLHRALTGERTGAPESLTVLRQAAKHDLTVTPEES